MNDAKRTMMAQRFGVLFQSGALWSSMTVGENVALPMQMDAQSWMRRPSARRWSSS